MGKMRTLTRMMLALAVLVSCVDAQTTQRRVQTPAPTANHDARYDATNPALLTPGPCTTTADGEKECPQHPTLPGQFGAKQPASAGGNFAALFRVSGTPTALTQNGFCDLVTTATSFLIPDACLESPGGGVPVRQSTNCAAETGGVTSEWCQQTSDDRIFVCETGPCNGTGWALYTAHAALATHEGLTTAHGSNGQVAGHGDTLGVFATTTSEQLAGVLSDETGDSGGFVRANNATMAAPTLTGTTTAATVTASGPLTGQLEHTPHTLAAVTQTHFNNANQAITWTLGSAVQNQNCCFNSFTFAQTINITPAAGTSIVMRGVDRGAGTTISSDGTAGQHICLTGFTATQWTVWGPAPGWTPP